MKQSSTIAYLCLMAGAASASSCGSAPPSPVPEVHPTGTTFPNFPALNIIVRSLRILFLTTLDKEFLHGLELERNKYNPRKQNLRLPLPRYPRKHLRASSSSLPRHPRKPLRISSFPRYWPRKQLGTSLPPHQRK